MDYGNRENWMSRLSRRAFVKGAGAAATVAGAGFAAAVRAESDLPRVDEQDPMARALNYAEDATSVDAAKRFSDHFCNNCVLYAGIPEDEWAVCSIFPGKVVAGRGWCSAWAPKAGQ